jgi:hypothetical protein
MGDSANKLPTQQEMELWQFDLARRIVSLGQKAQDELMDQTRASIESMVNPKPPVPVADDG